MNNYYQYGDPYATSTTTTDTTVSAGILMMLGLFYFLFLVAMYVVTAIFLGKIFKKAGVPSWIAWVPFYNTWKMLEIGGQQGFWAVLAIIPLVNIASVILTFIAMFHIGKKLGKQDAFVLLGIFLPLVWMIWLGADRSKWDESKGAPRRDTPMLPVNQEQPANPQNPTQQAPESTPTQAPTDSAAPTTTEESTQPQDSSTPSQTPPQQF